MSFVTFLFIFFSFFIFFFGIRSPMTSKREIKWCMVADWLKCDRLLFTFCGICITSNSAKSTPRTNPVLPSPRDTSGCLRTAGCSHSSLPAAQKQHWHTWGHLKLRHLAASAWINFIFFLIIFYLHFVCMRGRVRRHRGGRGSSQRLISKMSLNLQIQYGTSEVGWTLLSTRPARPCSTWKANSKVELSQAFAEWEKKQFTHTGKFAPTELLPVGNIHQLDHSQGRKGWSHPSEQGLPEGCESWRLQSFLNKS